VSGKNAEDAKKAEAIVISIPGMRITPALKIFVFGNPCGYGNSRDWTQRVRKIILILHRIQQDMLGHPPLVRYTLHSTLPGTKGVWCCLASALRQILPAIYN
jgi:hypothetical protein